MFYVVNVAILTEGLFIVQYLTIHFIVFNYGNLERILVNKSFVKIIKLIFLWKLRRFVIIKKAKSMLLNFGIYLTRSFLRLIYLKLEIFKINFYSYDII